MPDFNDNSRTENPSGYLLVIIGINIRNRRKELGYTQAQVAELMGESFSSTTVSNHERGGDHMNAGTLVMYSRILRIPVHALLADPVLKEKIAVTPEYYELSDGDRVKADEYIIHLWSIARLCH